MVTELIAPKAVLFDVGGTLLDMVNEPIKGAGDFLQLLRKKGIKIGFITNSTDLSTFSHLRNNGLFSTGDAFILRANKPSEEPALEACRKLDVRPQDCWFVGDGEEDIACAFNAGIFPIYKAPSNLGVTIEAVRQGMNRKIGDSEIQAVIDNRVKDFAELTERFKAAIGSQETDPADKPKGRSWP